MSGRDQHESRVATPLELFFDLAFVVAISFAARALHHDIVEQHYVQAVVSFVTSFFAIWWAWMNYTWFASAYDTDDVPYRLLTMLQMSGVVLLAIGISDTGGGLGPVQVAGYVIMRLALVTQWLRAAREDPDHRATAHRYALGIMIVQCFWIAAVTVLPSNLWIAWFLIGVAAETTVPRIAERAGRTPWHPHHIAERHSLLVIIVLGEGVLGMTNALAGSIEALGWTTSLTSVGPASIAILLGMWWSYFLTPYGDRLAGHPEAAWRWSYSHFAIFASLAALGAGLEVAEATIEHADDVSGLMAASAIGIPLATYLLAIWLVHRMLWGSVRWHDALMTVLLVVIAAIVGLAALGLHVQYVIALFVLVPVLLVVTAERRGRVAQ